MATTSTLPDSGGLAETRRGRIGRRIFVAVLLIHLLLGLLFVYGPKTEEKKVSAGPHELTVRYTSRSRPGLAAPWSLEIRRAGGFGDKPVAVSMTSSYFELFDENGFDPEPISSRNAGDDVIWEFEAPKGDTLNVSFDGRVEPGVQLSWKNARTAVLVNDKPVVSVNYRTMVFF